MTFTQVEFPTLEEIETPSFELPDLTGLLGFMATARVMPDARIEAPKMGDDLRRGLVIALEKLLDALRVERAPAPSDGAHDRAARFKAEAEAAGVSVDEEDDDVLGGRALFFFSDTRRRAWLSCLDNGADTLVLTHDDGKVETLAFSDKTWEQLKAFLGR